MLSTDSPAIVECCETSGSVAEWVSDPLHYARSKEYNRSPAPSAKKNINRLKKRGPIMAANKNQNLIALLSANLSQPYLNVRTPQLTCLQPERTGLRITAPRTQGRMVGISGWSYLQPSSHSRRRQGSPAFAAWSSVPAR